MHFEKRKVLDKKWHTLITKFRGQIWKLKFGNKSKVSVWPKEICVVYWINIQ